jgi:hypothetical protein
VTHFAARDFPSEGVSDAIEFIDGLPPNVERIHVHVWDDGAWRFVWGGERHFVQQTLGALVEGRRFRLQDRE